MSAHIERWWRASRPLTAVGVVMLMAFVVSLAAMTVDHRTILGAPAWLPSSVRRPAV